MGQFIDTQQGLLSEAKQKRLEREQKQKDKKRQQTQEIELFYTLDNIIFNNSSYKKDYIFKDLHKPKNRDAIIDRITNGSLEDSYILAKKYNAILSNVYNGYKLNDKEITKAETETIKKSELKLFRILKNTLDFKEYHSKHASHYFKDRQEAYNFLIIPKNKDYIIETITSDIEKTYVLNKKYSTILNSLYRPYKQTEKQTETKTQQKTIKQVQTKKKNNGFIWFISIILGIAISIIKIIGYFVILPLILIFSKK